MNGIGLSASTTNGVYAAQFNGKVYLSAGYTTSDKNLKQNIEEFSGAMDIIGKLKPRYYEFKTDDKYAFLHLEKGKHYGLLAQDVEEVLPNLISTATHKNVKAPVLPDSTGRIKPDSSLQNAKAESISIKAVNYTELIPIIIKGMQEQEAANKIKDAKIANLEAEVNELRRIVLELKSSAGSVTSTSAYLEQNTPNPVSGTTIIGYHIPQSTRSASIAITNAKGQLVKTITISNKVTGQINLNTTMLAAGTYNYTLYVDGKLVDSKRLIITRW